MRWFQLTLLGLVLAGPARGEDIVDVLRRSQQQRLDTMTPAPDGPRARQVRESFEQLRRALPSELTVELQVITGATLAETLHGHIVVANESLADLPEGARLFVLAHELGHVASSHWRQMGVLYRKWVPGDVTPQTTEPVAALLGRDASGLAHRQEFEADAYAQKVLRTLGRPAQDSFAVFMHMRVQHDTATHPGTRKRVASLRAAQGGGASGHDAE